MKKKWTALLLAVCIAVQGPSWLTTALAANEGTEKERTAAGYAQETEEQSPVLSAAEENLTVSQIGAHPVDLTAEGDLDWVYFYSANLAELERKNVENKMISNMVPLGQTGSLTGDKFAEFSYTDGTRRQSNGDVYQTEKRGLILEHEGNGMTFDVKGSTQPRVLRLYTGAYAATVKTEIRLNDGVEPVKAFERVVGASQGNIITVQYQTESDADVLHIRMEVTDVTDSTYGSMSVHAVTVQDASLPAEPVTVVSEDLPQGETLPVNLTGEGNLDWAYFDSVNLNGYEYKDLRDTYVDSFITNVSALGTANGLTADRFAAFQFTDGTNRENNTGSYQTEKRGIIMQRVGGGLTFDVKSSKSLRTLKLYTGAYAATVKTEIRVNDEPEPVKTVTRTATATTGNVLTVQFYSENEEDVLHFRVEVTDVTDKTYGSVSVHAISLYDKNPPEVVPPDYSGEALGGETEAIQLNHARGFVNSLQFKNAGGEWVDVPFRGNNLQGPTWQWNGSDVRLRKAADNEHLYTGKRDGVEFGISYSIVGEDMLQIQATLRNTTDQALTPERASINLGIDTYMKDTYDSYKNLFFPTLLRCENTHLWGYFESPENHVVAITADAPVSSYRLSYESGAHRINGVVFDLMQADETLPERHPRDNATLAANAARTWNIRMKLSSDVQSVKEDVSRMLSAPSIDIDRYTLADGESARISVFAGEPVEEIAVTAPNGESLPAVALEKAEDGRYVGTFAPQNGEGVYKLQAVSGGYRAEAMITLRKPWSWYMEQAKEAAISHPAKAADCCESWYGLYSAYLGKKYFPDEEQDAQIEEKFDEIYRIIGYNELGVPKNNPSRIQNHSTTVGILVDKYQAGGDAEDLKKAIGIADYLISRQNQNTGAYQGPSGDYTSVIYPAKSIMELMEAEKMIMNTGNTDFDWQACYDRQYESVRKAMDNLVNLHGDLHTEGQLTFEDGAFSCSATQLSQFALLHPEGSAERAKYQESALEYLNKHQALEQEIIPDSRMNGGSLRFWEAQYDVLLHSNPDNMMNSPHGWTAWNIYGLFNMYQLTGDPYYLNKGMNAMGSCVQLMGLDGNLNWAFIADPYVKGSLFVQVENDTSPYGQGTRKDVILGESYVDMISDWWKAPPDTNVGGYYGQGGACDNDVHEIFKAMEETVLTKAYVAQAEDGSLVTYNCTAEIQDDGSVAIVTDAEEMIEQVSLNLPEGTGYTVAFANSGKSAAGTAKSGVEWIAADESAKEPQMLNVQWNPNQANVEIAGETDVILDGNGIYGAKVVPGTKLAFTFTPANGPFASAKLNGENIPFEADGFTYTYTMPNDKAVLRFTFTSVNKSVLETLLEKANEVTDEQLAGLVESVSNRFIAARGNAKAVYEDDTTTQEEVNEAWKELLDAMHYLSFEAGTKEQLEYWLDYAAMLDLNNFTPKSLEGYAEALAYAEEIYNDEGETLKAEVEKAANNLHDAIMRLEFKADTETLALFVKQAQEIDLDEYLDGPEKDAFEEVLPQAEALLADGNATQKQVDAMTDKLFDALAGLRVTPDREALKDLLEESEALDPADYTEASYAILRAALNLAWDTCNDENATPKDIAVRYATVEKARAGLALTEKPEEPEKPDNKPSRKPSNSGGKKPVGNTSGTGTAVAVTNPLINAVQNVMGQKSVRSDTTADFTLKRGNAYCFKMTVVNGSSAAPNFTVGNGSVLKTQFVAKIGNDYYYRVWAVGTPGQSTGVYTTMAGEAPQQHCVVTIG